MNGFLNIVSSPNSSVHKRKVHKCRSFFFPGDCARETPRDFYQKKKKKKKKHPLLPKQLT